MDLGAYHRAWLGGATEAEAIRAGEDAFLNRKEEQEYYNNMEQEYYKEAEQEYYKDLNNKTAEEAGREQGMEKHWCMCGSVRGVVRDGDATCLICGGKDAYGLSKSRPADKIKTVSELLSF